MKRWPHHLVAAAAFAAAATGPCGAVAQDAAGPAPAGASVNFSFDGADIRLLVKLVGELTGRRFVVDDAVSGTVTVVSPAEVPIDEVYPLLLSILEARGFSVVEREGTCFVVPLAEQTPLPPSVAPPDGVLPEGLLTRVFRLQHLDAVEFARSIEPLVRGGKAGMVSAFGPTNHLIVTDTGSNLQRVADILAEMDQPGSARVVEVVALEHASAEDLAEQVAAAMAGSQKAGSQVSRHLRQVAEGGGALPSEMYVVPAAHANSLVLVGTPVQLAELKRVIGLLDVEPVSGYGRLNAVFLKYLSAEEAAKSLNALLAKTVVKDERQRIAIEPSPSNNALLVDASPRDFQWVKELVDRLDRVPQQVLVEILIAEVGLNNRLDVGVEWSTVETPSDSRNTIVGRSRPGSTDAVLETLAQGAFPQGVSVGVARGLTASGVPRMPFLLTALKSNQDLRILSSVPLWAQNNTEASVSVVENIPILRSTIQGGSGTSRDVIQNIDRMDVGIKLKITPHVNPDREVTLQLNPSIEAIVDPGPSSTDFAPTIAKREVSTTVTVADGTTVVLSGLIREDRVQRVHRVPLLGDIPLLGHLFRYTSDEVKRNNLLLFVTPSIVSDGEEAARIRRTLEERTGLPGGAQAETPEPPQGS